MPAPKGRVPAAAWLGEVMICIGARGTQEFLPLDELATQVKDVLHDVAAAVRVPFAQATPKGRPGSKVADKEFAHANAF